MYLWEGVLYLSFIGCRQELSVQSQVCHRIQRKPRLFHKQYWDSWADRSGKYSSQTSYLHHSEQIKCGPVMGGCAWKRFAMKTYSSMTQALCIHYWQSFHFRLCLNLGCHSPLFYCGRNVLLQNPSQRVGSPENSFHSCRRVWINPCSLERSRVPVRRATLCSWTCLAATWKASVFNQAFFFFFCSFLDGLAFRRRSVPY